MSKHFYEMIVLLGYINLLVIQGCKKSLGYIAGAVSAVLSHLQLTLDTLSLLEILVLS